MSSSRSNVVPFERPAAYWAVRARKHYSPRKLPDAARLMRKALEKSGDVGLALELAEIYSGMECYTAAERCLIRAVARQGLTGSLCFSIGCCALSQGDEELAEEALDQSLRMDPSGVYAERAQDILEYYPWRGESSRPHCARAEELQRMSMRLVGTEKAVELAKKAWKKGHSPRVALWLGTLLPPREALPYFKYAEKRLTEELQPHLCLAAACALLKDGPNTRRQLQLALPLCHTIADAEMFCATAWQSGRPQFALRLILKRLEASPASVDYLRLKYLTLRRMPGEEENARRTLETLLEIDPDDGDGLYYRRHPEETGLNPQRAAMLSVLGSMVFSLPRRLKPGKLNRLLHMMSFTLADDLTPEEVSLALPSLWRCLTKAEQRALDEYRPPSLAAALAICVLLKREKGREALSFYHTAPGKRRFWRLFRRISRRHPLE